MRRRNMWKAISWAALAGSVWVLGACRTPEGGALAEGRAAELIGEPFPSFRLPQVADTTRTLAWKDLEGKPALVVFWATWCQPCLAEARELPGVRQDLSEHGVRLVSLNVDETPEAVALVARRAGMDWDLARDALPLFDSLGLEALPQSFLVGPDGRILEAFSGMYERPVLVKAIRQALERSAKP